MGQALKAGVHISPHLVGHHSGHGIYRIRIRAWDTLNWIPITTFDPHPICRGWNRGQYSDIISIPYTLHGPMGPGPRPGPMGPCKVYGMGIISLYWPRFHPRHIGYVSKVVISIHLIRHQACDHNWIWIWIYPIRDDHPDRVRKWGDG